MKFKIKFADQIVGLFILVALAFFVAIVVLIGANQRWFAKDYRFTTTFSSASGVAPGTSITMKGFTVGKIDKISLNEDNEVDAAFHIFDTYYQLVLPNSVLELTISPVGLGSSLLFHPGRPPVDPLTGLPQVDPETGLELPPQPLAEGSYIPSTATPEGQAIMELELADVPVKDDTITRLLANVNPLLENVNKVVVTINRTLTEVNRSLAGQSTGPLGTIVGDIGAATARLPGTMDDVDAIVADVQQRVAGLLDQVSTLLTEVNAVTANLAVTTEAIRDPTGLVPRLLDPKGSIKTFLDDGNALYKKVMSIIAEVESSAASLSGIVDSLNGEMPKIAAMLNETRIAIKQAQEVLEGVRNNPLIRGGVTERTDQASLYGSLREGDFE